MKTFNKYFFLLAAVLLSFTACEDKTEREPSPEATQNGLAFALETQTADINPNKDKLEVVVRMLRSTSEVAAKYTVEVVEADDVFTVPKTVSFAQGSVEGKLKVALDNVVFDESYTLTLRVLDENKSEYMKGYPQTTVTVNIAAWEAAATQAIVFDGIVNSMYGISQEGWYVDYTYKQNPDGSFDYVFENVYTRLPDYANGDYDSPIADQFGLYGGFPYNYPTDVDGDNDYNWTIHVTADGVATFEAPFELGMLWNEDYGWFIAGLEEDGAGVYNKATNTIVFEAGNVWGSMTKLTRHYYAEDDIVIYLDAVAYQSDHLSIEDFNGSDLVWVAQENAVNIFESELFKLTNENQQLYAAVDQAQGNPKSPYLNLFGLKGAYGTDAVLAFYWDKSTDEIEVPEHQYTGVSVGGQKIFIEYAEAEVEHSDVKGTAVTTISFFVEAAYANGQALGEFVETFTLAEDNIVFAREDYIGEFVMSGADYWDKEVAEFPVEIVDVDGELALLDVSYCDTLWCDFDVESGVLSIESQQTGDYGPYDIAFITMNSSGADDTSISLDLAYRLTGVIGTTNSSEAVGFFVVSETAGGAVAGFTNIKLTPASEVNAAPRRKPSDLKAKLIKQGDYRLDAVHTTHLKPNGQNVHRILRKNIEVIR